MPEYIYIVEKSSDMTMWADLPDMPLVVACGENAPTLELNLRAAMDSWMSDSIGKEADPMTWSQAEALVRRRAKEMGVDPGHYEMRVISDKCDEIKFEKQPLVDPRPSNATQRRSFMKKVFIGS